MISCDKMVYMFFKIHMMIFVPFANMNFLKEINHLVYLMALHGRFLQVIEW